MTSFSNELLAGAEGRQGRVAILNNSSFYAFRQSLNLESRSEGNTFTRHIS